MKISTKIHRLQKKLEDINVQIQLLQDQCTHPNVQKTYKADRGNYDPSCDRRWIEYSCPDCQKFWIEEK